MKNLRNENGVVLITVLLLMLIMTFLGIMVIDTSTIDMQIAGNFKRATTAFEGAEAGVELSVPIIERTMFNSVMPAYNALDAVASDLEDEITGGLNNSGDALIEIGGTAAAPDITINDLNGVKIEVDIDRLMSDAISGSALEFASGYEGVGAGAAGGGTQVLFRIVSQGTR